MRARAGKGALAALALTIVFGGVAAAGPPQTLNNQGVALLEKGDYGAALTLLQQAAEALPYNETVRGNLAASYLGLGRQHLEAARLAEAAEAFREGRAVAADDGRFATYLGLVHLRQGNLLEAEADLHEALSLDGDSLAILRLLGQVHYDGGDLTQALQAWERAERIEPNNAEILALLEKTRRELAVERTMERSFGAHFEISYDGEVHGDLGDEVLEALQDAYYEVGMDLGFYPEVKVPVLLYTREEFSRLTASPDWSGGLYDGKIRIPLKGLHRMQDQLRAVLAHEYSHVAVRFLGGHRIPWWLNEGLAEVAGRRYFSPPLTQFNAALDQQGLLPFRQLERYPAGLATEQVRLAYEQSYSLVSHFLERYGWYRMKQLLRAAAQQDDFVQSFNGVMAPSGIDYEGMLNNWRLEQGLY